MDAQDEKFFASLAGTGKYDDEYQAELAKAEAAALARARSRGKAAEFEKVEPEGQLTVDVYQTADEIVVESAIAGVRPEDIDINVTPDSISIRGTRRRESKPESEDYLYQECYWGRFARSIILPQEVDPENADVIFKNGILTVHLPKMAKRRTRKLQVRME